MPLDEDGFAFEGFEWDPKKTLSNIVKHGIDFARALPVFSDPLAVIFESRSHHSEARQLIVGQVDGRFVTVVFTLREGRVRIVSARRARKSERNRYGQ